MDKYEYNLKLEEITKLADQGYYEDAADIIDTIDWRRVRNVRTLCMKKSEDCRTVRHFCFVHTANLRQ